MGRSKKDAPRVVGFDFGPPAGPGDDAPAASPVPPPAWFPEAAAPPAPPPAYPPPAYPPPAPPPAVPEYAGTAAAASLDQYSGGYAAAAPAYAPPAAPGGVPWSQSAPAAEPWGGAPYQVSADFRPAPPPAREGLSLWLGVAVKVVVVVVVVGGGVKGAMRTLQPPAELPASLAGVPRDDTAEARQIAAVARDGIENVHGLSAAVYGTADGLVYLLAAGDADDENGQEMYENYARDVQADGMRTTRGRAYGKTTCGTTTGTDGPFSICMWGGSKSDGILMSFERTDLTELALVAQEARAAIED